MRQAIIIAALAVIASTGALAGTTDVKLVVTSDVNNAEVNGGFTILLEDD